MKRTLIFLTLLSMSLIGGVCNSDQKTCTLAPADFKTLCETRKGILIDVRTLQEYDTAHIAGAVNLNFADVQFSRVIHTLDKQQVYLLYCKKGLRSEKARQMMVQEGFGKVCTLAGGMDAWMVAGYPIVNNILLSSQR